MRALSGITVVSVEQAVAAPFATRQLADLGARVIKVERPDGDFARAYDRAVRGWSSHFVWLNRSKESVVLDLKTELGRTALQRLLERADVFVHNLSPGALDRLGFPPAEVARRHPRLVVCGISGYGTAGPYRDRKAYDLLVQAESGLLSITGTPEEPVKVGISVADIAAGMYAFCGILAALYRRERTGRGALLEVSLLDALAEWMGYPLYYTAYGGRPPARTGAHHATIAPYGPFPTRDGTLFLAVQNDGEWERLCREVLGRPDLATDPRFATNPDRLAHREELEATLREALARWTAEDLAARLQAADLAYARLRTVEELRDHPQLRARNRWREVPSPVGPLLALVPPVTADEEPVLGPVPALGEHTEAVLRELGLAG